MLRSRPRLAAQTTLQAVSGREVQEVVFVSSQEVAETFRMVLTMPAEEAAMYAKDDA